MFKALEGLDEKQNSEQDIPFVIVGRLYIFIIAVIGFIGFCKYLYDQLG